MNSTTLRLRLQLLHQLLEVLEVDRLAQHVACRSLRMNSLTSRAIPFPVPANLSGGPHELRRLGAVQRMEVMTLSMKTM